MLTSKKMLFQLVMCCVLCVFHGVIGYLVFIIFRSQRVICSIVDNCSDFTISSYAAAILTSKMLFQPILLLSKWCDIVNSS
uniref:Putative secreted protein n=1 Tax=Psorophora albipes TaxID=869069 RepID=T1DFY9_9DIPT